MDIKNINWRDDKQGSCSAGHCSCPEASKIKCGFLKNTFHGEFWRKPQINLHTYFFQSMESICILLYQLLQLRTSALKARQAGGIFLKFWPKPQLLKSVILHAVRPFRLRIPSPNSNIWENSRIAGIVIDLWSSPSHCSGRITQSRWHGNASRWVWGVSREGGSTPSLGSYSSSLPPSFPLILK